MKEMINQIKTTRDTITDRQYHTEERISGIEDKAKTIIQTDTYKEKDLRSMNFI